MRIGIDLDGVCYDFAASLRRWLCGTNQWEMGVSPLGYLDDTNCTYCSVQRYPEPQRWEFYLDWFAGHEDPLGTFKGSVKAGVEAGVVFRWGDPHPGTAEALKTLLDQGHTLVFVTDRVGLGGEKAKELTHEWLHEHFPFMYLDRPESREMRGLQWEIHFDSDKTAYNTDIFLDDKLENCDALYQVGMKAVLWDRPWNQTLTQPSHLRVSSWDEFLQEVGYAEMNKGTETLQQMIDEFRDEVRVTSSTGGQKGKKLARFGLIPKNALRKVAELYGRGAEKYDDWNWRKGYDFSLSIDSLHRHLASWEEGETLDPETGCHNLAAVVFHALSLMTFEDEHPEFDNRWKGDAA